MAKETSNVVAEWFGHRVYPTVQHDQTALTDQQSQRCPFLSDATQEYRRCIKNETSKGVCTVSSTSNGPRQDWLVCPHRALDPDLLEDAIDRLFGIPSSGARLVVPVSTLIKVEVREAIWQNALAGNQTFVYFHEKLGGEISFSKTPRSPEMKLDLTLVELTLKDEILEVGKFGILELQTMEFHGSYRAVVKNLQDSLRLFGPDFHSNLEANLRWLWENVEGPNIANVFKRTFYQMMFKFHIGAQPDCAGVVLAIPEAVWQSWQHHLGKPELGKHDDFSTLFSDPEGLIAFGHIPAWIYIYKLDSESTETPNPLRVIIRIATDADSIGYYALKVAPTEAISEGGSVSMLPLRIRQRITRIWPGFTQPSRL